MNLRPCVHVIDDDEEVRRSIQLLLTSASLDAESYTSAADFLARFAEDPARPAVALVDVQMPGMDGMALLERLRTEHPDLPVIMVTGYGDIEMAVRAMKLGAADFMTKPLRIGSLLARVRELALDNTTNSAEANPGAEPGANRDGAGLAILTAREREVFERIIAGNANKVIAADLAISTRTVESHRARIMTKLGAKSVVDLVIAAMQDSTRRQPRAAAPQPHGRPVAPRSAHPDRPASGPPRAPNGS